MLQNVITNNDRLFRCHGVMWELSIATNYSRLLTDQQIKSTSDHHDLINQAHFGALSSVECNERQQMGPLPMHVSS